MPLSGGSYVPPYTIASDPGPKFAVTPDIVIRAHAGLFSCSRSICLHNL